MSSRREGLSSGKSGLDMHRNVKLSDEEVDAIIQGFAQDDEDTSKTLTRRAVESYLQHKKWYNPRAGSNDDSDPSLEKAYAYYEHITLPRHFSGDEVADHVYHRAEPGESTEKTDLFNPFTTPASAFIEWGIGVDLYFSSLRSLSALLFMAGLINIPAIMYYSSTEYSPDGHEDLDSLTLKGSAVCTTYDWVVCADCKQSDFNDDTNERSRFAVTDDRTTIVQHSLCNGVVVETVIPNWLTLLFITAVMILLSHYWRAREVRFDEDKITTTDYSIVVKNPPPDAYDPDEWRAFFNHFGDKQVTCVTVGLNNDEMLRKLVIRREARNLLEMQLPKGTDMDDEDLVRTLVAGIVREQEAEPKGCIGSIIGCVTPILNIFGMLLPPDKLVDKVFALTQEIKELQKEKYDVVKVYVTFETEEGQRSALETLAVGKIDSARNNTSSVAGGFVFRDRVLKIEEPCEPNAVRWLDLGAGTFRRIFARVVNIIITGAAILLAVVVVDRVRKYSTTGAAVMITLLNSTVPTLLKLLMIFERHSTEGGYQTSLYLKVTVFRWVNTAIVTKFITPIIGTLTTTNESVLVSINSILWSELWLTPILRLSDWMTNAKKHLLAPRARTQEQMNMYFQGTFYNLGERYTDLTKILFLVFNYGALLPAAFFFGSAILIIQYYADKYCLMRIWASIPTIGPELPKFSRRYFFSLSVLAFCLLSAFAWAQYPYDDLCIPKSPTDEDFSGTYTVSFPGQPDRPPETVTVNSPVRFLYCPQGWRQIEGLVFPPTPRIQPDDRQWMNRDGDDTKETLISLYGYTALVYFIIFVVGIFGGSWVSWIMSFFRGEYKHDGQDQKVDFSSLTEKSAYVPQMKLIGRPFPYLACSIDFLDQELVGWNDPHRSYDYHNLTFDVPYPGMPRKKRIVGNTRNTRQIEDHSEFRMNSSFYNKRMNSEGEEVVEEANKFPIFSIVKHYPPEWQQKMFETEKEEPVEEAKEDEPLG